MGIKVKIIEKSKPGHSEEKLYYVVPDNTGITFFSVFAYKVSEFTGVYKKNRIMCIICCIRIVEKGILRRENSGVTRTGRSTLKFRQQY